MTSYPPSEKNGARGVSKVADSTTDPITARADGSSGRPDSDMCGVREAGCETNVWELGAKLGLMLVGAMIVGGLIGAIITSMFGVIEILGRGPSL